MATGRSAAEWERTATLMSLVANSVPREKDAKPITPADFDPHADRPDPDAESIPIEVADLKALFFKRPAKRTNG